MCYQPIEIRVEKLRTKVSSGTILVSCRQCLECRQKRAKEWALRCMMEAEKYQAKCFITLTYAKNPLTLQMYDLQCFIKRLRKAIHPNKIRYFACGEYGDARRRPHYHILIYGYDFPDKYRIEDSNSGKPQYMSDQLDKLWSLDGENIGRAVVQDMTLQSAAYCALYSAKPKKHLPKYLQDRPEFNTMSQGLGVDVMMSHMDTYLLTDEVWYDGKKHIIPQVVLNRYFGKKDEMTEVEYMQYQAIKDERIKKGCRTEKSLLSELSWRDHEMYMQKKYRKENANKRLTKGLDRNI